MWILKLLRPKRHQASTGRAGTDEVNFYREEYMAVNPHTLGAQEGTYDYDRGPEMYRDNGVSEAIAMYDKVYQEKRKAEAIKKRYSR